MRQRRATNRAATLLDVRPLRESPAFLRLWVGTTLSVFGSQLASFAVLFLVWERTGNAALVGAIGGAQAVPMLVFALLGGRIADSVDRRTLVIVIRVGQLLASTMLAAVVISGTASVVPIFVVIAIQSGLNAVGAPASKTFVPRLLSGERLSAGLALTNLSFQISMLAGPLVGGLVIAWSGVGPCLVANPIAFVFALYGVARLPSMRPKGSGTETPGSGFFAAARLVARTPVLIGAFATDLCVTLLSMPVALFPVINAERYGGSSVTLGLFQPALAIGGVLAGTFSGRITRSRKQGLVMLVSGGIWGVALVAFGAADRLWLALPALALAGAADVASVVSRATLVQEATPDAYRGRVNAIDYLVGVGGPQLGNLRAGVVASATGGAASAMLGGLAAALGVASIALGIPAVRRYRRSE